VATFIWGRGGKLIRSGQLIDPGARIDTHVCIVGAGPAGLTLASELGAAGTKVVLLESGGRDFDHPVQSLSSVTFSEGVLSRQQYHRRRQVGGGSNVWEVRMMNRAMGVRYTPLDDVYLRPRTGSSLAEWPLGEDDLRAHYDAAQITTQAGPFDYSAETWSKDTSGPWPLDASLVVSKAFRFGPRAAFYGDLADRVAASDSVTVVHDATAVELLAPDSASPITDVRCQTLGGHTFTVAAKRFVLAASGIGNPHLLLASRSARAAGFGNENDLVGRYLQDHPLVEGGSLHLYDPGTWDRSTFYDMREVDGHSGLGYLALSPQAIESQGLGGLAALLFPRPNERQTNAMEALVALSETAREHRVGSAVLKALPRLVMGSDYILPAVYRNRRYQQALFHSFERGGWSSLPRLSKKFTRFVIKTMAEQTPNAESRVTLNRSVDAVGMPSVNVQWRWTQADAERAGRGRRIMVDELHRAGIGKVILPDDGGVPGVGPEAGTGHYMGTTRMHRDPRRGVVDLNCRVHSVPNLYIAGSSVFPVSGYANPTLTIVALAHRLSKHLIELDKPVRATNTEAAGGSTDSLVG
jgi:choline dehydrogenase-like flavoprotein